MSLKWFHVFFIGASILLAIVVAVWAFQNGQWLLALVALGAGAGLAVYRNLFLQKVRQIGLR